MMIDEAKISMFLNHQNIVSVLDFAEEDGAYYIAMEYVQGTTVERLVDQLKHGKRLLDLPIGLFIGIEICRALRYAHACTNHLGEALNIVHRDVTPANVLLSIQGEVKLTDFGIARAKGRLHQTQAGVVKGKFGYLAPEIARYEQIDARADLFALGVVLYQLLAGQHPVAGASVMEAIFRFEEKQLPRPSSINPAITPEIEAIILRALEPRPEDRWSSAQELQVALQEAAMSDPGCRRGLPHAAKSLTEVLREVVPESFEDPMPAETPRDPTMPPGYAGFSTQIFGETGERSLADAPLPRVPSAALKKKPLPGIPSDASFVELIPARPPIALDATMSDVRGGGFGESTTTDMPKLPDPSARTDSGLIEAPSGDFEAQPTTFDEPTATNHDRFGAETSQDIPRLPDPEVDTASDADQFMEQTRVDHAVGDTEAEPQPLSEQTGFGDKTIADPSFRALVPPTDTLRDEEEEEGGYEPTRIREQSATKEEDELENPAEISDAVPVPVETARGDPFGGKTEKWIQGKLDPAELSWNDEDAARRAVETRNVVRGQPATNPPPRNPAPVIVGKPSAVAVRTSHPPSAVVHQISIGVPAPAPPAAPPPPAPPALTPQVSPFTQNLGAELEVPPLSPEPRSQRGVIIAAIVVFAVAVGTIGGALIYPRIYAPTLQITSAPTGAEVMINGAQVPGTTPVELEVEPGVEQHIEVTLEGYEPVARDVGGIERGQTYAITITLDRVVPELRIAPVAGRVIVNGRDRGVGPRIKLSGLDPEQPVDLRVEANGFETHLSSWPRAAQIPAIVDIEMKRK
jgi:serine/threonine protein kinase